MPTYGVLKINDVGVSGHRLGVTNPTSLSTDLTATQNVAKALAVGPTPRVYVVARLSVFNAVFWTPVAIAVNGSLVPLGQD